jgi:hypothetical protein
MRKIIEAIVFLFLCNSHVFAWERFEVIDEFTGKKLIGYLQTASNTGGGLLVVRCDKKIKIDWQAGSPQAQAAAAAPGPGSSGTNPLILIRTDEDPVRKENWNSKDSEVLSPRDALKFFNSVRGKSELRIKDEAHNRVGVFIITGMDEVFSDMKNFCR